MKVPTRLLILLQLALCVQALLPACVIADTEKTRVAIIAFDSVVPGEQNRQTGRIVSEMLTTAAVKSRVFSIVERQLIKRVMHEMEFGDSGLSGSDAQKIGSLVGADAVLSGTVTVMGEDLRIDARLINVKDGQILHAESSYARSDLKSIGNAADNVMQKMVAALYPDAAPMAAPAESIPDPDKSATQPEHLQDDGPPPTIAQESIDLSNFNQWEVLDGSWREHDGAFIGRGGHLFHDLPYHDYVFSVLVTFLEGDFGAAGVLMRGSLVPGTRRFRNNTMDIQGYGFNFTPNRTFNIFGGIEGKWYLLNKKWKQWPSQKAIARENRVVVSCRDTSLQWAINGVTVFRTEDYFHDKGGVVLWVQEPAQIVRFSDISLTLQ